MRGFGIDALDLDGARDARSALAAALRRRGPCLIHATIDTAEQVLPMVPPGAANTQMIVRGARGRATRARDRCDGMTAPARRRRAESGSREPGRHVEVAA